MYNSGMLRRVFSLAALAVLLSLPTGQARSASGHTSDAELVNTTITGLGTIGGDFEFLDDSGRLRNLEELRGDVVSVFFGFTNCADVCPGYLAKTSVVRELLGERGDSLKVVFVTIDPERDDRVTLRDYLRLFDRSNNIGARVPGGKLPEVLKLYSASTHHFMDGNDRLMVTHSVGSYLLDRGGRPSYYVPGDKGVEEFAALVEELLDA